MRQVRTSWRIIETVLRENASTVFNALNQPATDDSIENLVTTIPAKLPNDFLQSLRIHDGIQNAFDGSHRIFDNKAMLPIADIIADWNLMWNLQLECELGGCAITRTRKIKNDTHWRAKWIPLLDSEGDKLVMDLDPGPSGQRGQLFLWYNSGARPLRVVAESFSHWLSMVSDDLNSRKFRLDEFGGIWLKRHLAS